MKEKKGYVRPSEREHPLAKFVRHTNKTIPDKFTWQAGDLQLVGRVIHNHADNSHKEGGVNGENQSIV